MDKLTSDAGMAPYPMRTSVVPKARPSKSFPRVALVASGGGHWVELLRLSAAWSGKDVAYVTVQPSYRSQVPGDRFYCVEDATRWSRWSLLKMVTQVVWVMLRERPDVVISSGALPGLVALRIGKWLGARTLWIDSIANVESLSMSGQHVSKFADLRLTQWQHLETSDGPKYRGAVL
jgi:UDP-N-acetylglucosamine:LPS N-acetylglucosamine transferase